MLDLSVSGIPLSPRPGPKQAAPSGPDDPLRASAAKLEATFLAEMLKSAGFGKPVQGFDGGAGEAQFASFLRMEQADRMVQAGGIGLAESLYRALKERSDAQ